jgi:S1-C subfamily serine protease
VTRRSAECARAALQRERGSSGSTRAARPAALIAVLLSAVALSIGCGGGGGGPGGSRAATGAAATPSSGAKRPAAPISLAYLGVRLAPAPAGSSGALVRAVADKGSASLLRPGDLIVAIGGAPVAGEAAVERALRRSELGDRLSLAVVRGSRRIELEEVLSPRSYLGAEVRPRGGELHVAAVASGSPAARAGMRRGDVLARLDGKPVADVSGVLAILAAHAPGDTVRLAVVRGSRRLTLTATLGAHPGER